MPALRKDARALEMYRRYQDGLSLAGVALEFGVTRQSVYGLLSSRGFKLRTVIDLPDQMFNGVRYTPGKAGYYRRSNSTRSQMHRDVWEFYNGPIPGGHDVHHKDEDRTNNAIENLECLSKAAHTIHHFRRVVDTKACKACGHGLKRHYGESPSAYAVRKTCGISCAASLRKGKPRGEKL